ncbi:transposase (06) [Paenibacillus thiaminolyticus]|nr:transposase (06) [Paenibacillus thiaminolyticus]
MCDVLQISRSTYYYEEKERHYEDEMTKPIVEIFEKNRKAYGTRKIKAKLHERGLIDLDVELDASMKEQGLVSTYTVTQYKPHKAACNQSQQPIELNRQFQQTEAKRVVVSVLTYVKVKTDGSTFVYWLTSLIERSLALAQA